MRTQGIAITLLITFASISADAQHRFSFPSPESFQPERWSQEQLLTALSKNSSAKSCTFEGKNISCSCVVTPGFRMDQWRPDAILGYLKVDGSKWLWMESLTIDRPRVAYAENGTGFIATLEKDDTLTDVHLGEVARPDCGDAPTISRVEAVADMATYKGDWVLSGFRNNGSPKVSVGTRPSTGWVLPTVRSDEETFEVESGLFLSPIRSAIVLNGSNRWLGAGLSIATRNGHDDFRYATLQARYDFDEEKLRPFAHGNFFIGNPQTHLSGRIEHPQPGRFDDTRQLDRNRLFRNHDLTILGTSLSGKAFTFQTTLGFLTQYQPNDQDTDLLMTARYATRFRIGALDADLSARYTADQRDIADDRLLQSTTIATRFSRNLLGNGMTLRPAIIFASNFGVLPVDEGIDASATGLLLAQVNAGVPIVGRFESFTHRIEPQLTVGRDIAGFQQRFLRDGGSPFPFRRRSGWTYGQLALNHAIETNAWSVRTPVGIQMFADDEATFIPWASTVVTHRDATLEATVTCETVDCDVRRYLGRASFQISNGLSARYLFSNFTAAQTVQRLAPALESDPTVSILWTQNFPLVISPDWIHSAGITALIWNTDFGFDATYDATTERGGVSASVTRAFPRLGWALAGRFGVDPQLDSWNASAGFRGSFRTR